MNFVINPPANPSQNWPSTREERTHAVWLHMTVLVALAGGVVLSLILWLAKRDRSVFIDDHGKEVLNFQMSFLIYWVVGCIFALVGAGKLVLGVVFFGALIALIRGIKAAQRGELYRYPMCLRFVR